MAEQPSENQPQQSVQVSKTTLIVGLVIMAVVAVAIVIGAWILFTRAENYALMMTLVEGAAERGDGWRITVHNRVTMDFSFEPIPAS